MKFNEDKCKALQVGQNYPMPQHWLGTDWLASSSAERDLEVLLNKANRSQQRAPALMKGNYILSCIWSVGSKAGKTIFSPPLRHDLHALLSWGENSRNAHSNTT